MAAIHADRAETRAASSATTSWPSRGPTGATGLELAVTDLEEMIDFWTDYLKSVLGPEQLADWLKGLNDDDDPT